VARVRDEQQAISDGHRPALLASGLVYEDKKGEHVRTGLLKQWVEVAFEARGEPPPRTENDAVSTSKETLLKIQDDVPLVEAYLERQGAQKLLNTFLPLLEKSAVVHTRYVPVVSTGRTSSSGPNVQNLPRDVYKVVHNDDGTMKKVRNLGIRESFIPREGNVFSSCDFAVLELRTLAQVCVTLGWQSELAKVFQSSREADPHNDLGGEISKIDSTTEKPRQLAKACNFGVPGGLGARTFVQYLRAYGVKTDVAGAKRLIEFTKNRWTELHTFFRYVTALRQGEWHTVRCPVTGFLRGHARYTAACNTHFQGLAGYGAKAALYEVVKACHLFPGLEGSFPVAFIHDEILSEHPLEVSSDHARIVANIMENAMVKHATPDIPQVVKPVTMNRWSRPNRCLMMKVTWCRMTRR